jgi:hypothetical protein
MILNRQLRSDKKRAESPANPASRNIARCAPFTRGADSSISLYETFLEGNARSIEGNTPSAEGNKTFVEGNAPSVEGNETSIEGCETFPEGNTPGAEGNTPSAEGCGTSIEPNTRSVEGWETSVERNISSARGGEGSLDTKAPRPPSGRSKLWAPRKGEGSSTLYIKSVSTPARAQACGDRLVALVPWCLKLFALINSNSARGWGG